MNLQYNPQIHHHRSIRLKGYDYAQSGLYFITICCQDRLHLFGHIQNGEMIYNAAGRMVEKNEKYFAKLSTNFKKLIRHETLISIFMCFFALILFSGVFFRTVLEKSPLFD